MKRPVLAVLLLLLLGLCSSLLVAWAGALVDRDGWPDTPLTGATVGTRTEMRGWLVEAGRDRTLAWRTFAALDLWAEPPDLAAPTTLPGWSVGRTLADQPGPFAPAREGTRDVAWEVSAGWPMRCVRATRTAGPSEFALPGEFVRGGLPAMAYGWPAPHGAAAGHEGIEISPWPIDGLAATIPLRPMVGGLLVNTLVHALAWFVLLLPLCLPGPLRRWRRRRKNRCTQCGHARDGLPNGAPCAECGRDPNARTPLCALLIARSPMLGAALALILVLSASAALLTHRWMAVDRLPALHQAAAVGDVEGIERLVAAGADIGEVCGELAGSSWDVYGTTALHWAAARGHTPSVRTLLSHGLDPRAGTAWNTPKHTAMEERHEDIVELLLPYPEGGGSHWFTGQGLPHTSPAIAALVLDQQAQSTGALHDAAVAAVIALDVQLLDELLRHGADPFSIGDGNVFELAVELDAAAWREPYRHDLGLTRAVMARGYGLDPRAMDRRLQRGLMTDDSPAVVAVRRARDRLLRSGGDGEPIAPIVGVARHGHAALYHAALHYEAFLVRALLEDGVDPRVPHRGQTPVQALKAQHEAALADPQSYHGIIHGRRTAQYASIIDLLEAAEAEWNAGAEPDPAPPTPGGP